MKTVIAAIALIALTALTACGSDTGGDAATDPAGSGGSNPMPTDPPASPGTVHTRSLATVMDTGRPELCLGPVAESYPPQCGGPEIVGWDWADHQVFEEQGKVRWGEFAVTGTWDGSAFTVKSAVPAAKYDGVHVDEPTVPEPARSYVQAELDDIGTRLGRELPGAQGAFADQGHVFVDVVYDDGSLQAWADEEYGKDVVIVVAALLDS